MMTKTFVGQTAAKLLNTNNDMLRRWAVESEIEVRRQENGPQKRQYTASNLYDLAAWRSAKQGRARGAGPKVVTVYAPKGGVGKTTIASNLACIFPLMGLKTLVVDIDFQSNLTLSFGYESELSLDEALALGIPESDVITHHFGHLVDGFDHATCQTHDIVKKPLGENGPHLIPSDTLLDRLDHFLTIEALRSAQSDLVFSRLIADGKKEGGQFADYDIILFDAAPSKSKITRNALIASDYVLAPISLEIYSTKSVSYLAAILTEMQKDFGRFPELMLLGNFFDEKRPRVLDQTAKIRSNYGTAWLDSVIRRSEDFPKSISADTYQCPLALDKVTSNASEDLRLAAEVIAKRIGVLA